ncbi:hypothetical protein Tco_1145636 [Tanacetum coccineum]
MRTRHSRVVSKLEFSYELDDEDIYYTKYRVKPRHKAILEPIFTSHGVPLTLSRVWDGTLYSLFPKHKSLVRRTLSPSPKLSEDSKYFRQYCNVPSAENDILMIEFGLRFGNRRTQILLYQILPEIDDDDFDEEEGEIDIDIFQIDDKILREKLLNVNLLIDKIEALNLTPFVLEYPSSFSLFQLWIVTSNIEDVDYISMFGRLDSTGY